MFLVGVLCFALEVLASSIGGGLVCGIILIAVVTDGRVVEKIDQTTGQLT